MLSKEEAVKLDYRIAVGIMGLKVVDDPVNYRGHAVNEAGSRGEDLPHFCTKIEEAMKVWDFLRDKGFRWLLNVDTKGFHLRNVASIRLDIPTQEKFYTVDRPLGTAEKIEDLPRVICEAALKEVNQKVESWVKSGMEAEAEGLDPGPVGRRKD